MSKPLVSVIIPNYNYGHFIGECIESAIKQTYDNIEIIIVDDGSTDNTKEIVVGIISGNNRKKIYYFYKEDGPSGTPAAINYGIKKSKGKYMTWLSSDDCYMPEKIARQVEVMEKKKNNTMTHTSFYTFDNGGKINGEDNINFSENNFYCDILNGCNINGNTIMIRKSIFEKRGLFIEKNKEEPDLWRVSEYLMWIVFAFNGDRVVKLNEKLHKAQLHNNNQIYKNNITIKNLLIIKTIDYYFKNQHNFSGEFNRNIDWGKVYNILSLNNLNNIAAFIAGKFAQENNIKNILIEYYYLFIFHIVNKRFKESLFYLKKIRKLNSETFVFLNDFYSVITRKKNYKQKINYNFSELKNYLSERVITKIHKIINSKNYEITEEDKAFEIEFCGDLEFIHNYKFIYNLGSKYESEKKYNESIKLFDYITKLKFINRTTYIAGAYYHLGNIAYLKSDYKKANGFLEKCLKNNCNFNAAINLLKKISEKENYGY